MEEGLGDTENIEHELDSEHASTKKRGNGSLDNSYLNGLYPGDIPEVLKCLNNIDFEKSLQKSIQLPKCD